MKHSHLLGTGIFVAATLLLSPAQAQVLPLDFTGGSGTTSVDQYTGIAGSGWSSAWMPTFHSGTNSGVAAISSTEPLVVGGGNYLQLNYNTNANATINNGVARVARQWDTSALSLTAPIQVQFDVRSLVDLGASTQTLTLFASNQQTNSTSSADSWRIYGDASGWYTFSYVNGPTNTPTTISLGTGAVKADETWRFTLTINPVTDTYSVAAQNLTTSSSLFTASNVALRNTADTSLSWLNFNATGTPGANNLGFAIDSVSVVPEPGVIALSSLGLLVLCRSVHRRLLS